MDNQELKDSQINLVLNSPDEDDSIDLGRVFHNMKTMRRVFGWVMILCMVVGLCVPLLLYQINKDPLTVFSAVTLTYQVDSNPDSPDSERMWSVSLPVLRQKKHR